MSKRDLLSVIPDFQDYLIALVFTALEPHQMAWSINKICATNFWRGSMDLKIPVAKLESEFVNFKFKPDYCDDIFWLIANYGSLGSLVNTKPKPNYILASKAEDASLVFKEWLDLLNKDANIVTAYIADDALKSKMKWLIWLNEIEE